MQISPSEELTPFIKHYLFLESRGNDLKKLRLFSDGNMAIVFSFKSNLIAGSENNGLSELLPKSFLYGQISAFKDVRVLNETSLAIVVFQPSGINQLLGIPAGGVRDTIIPAEYLFGKREPELYEKLAEAITIREKLKLLNHFFEELVAKKMYPEDAVIKASLQLIIKNKGVTSLHQLVKLTGYTERHIERKFIESVGINPRKFGNIIRLQHFLKQLKNEPINRKLTAIAYETGYADQSHLIKEFKKFTGMTPKTYVNKADKLTINFVKLLP
ncbi:MAG: helix-turn-helix domain-containing protein [Chitinophagaceae bacterium]